MTQLTRDEVIDLVVELIHSEAQKPHILAEEIFSSLEKAGVLILVDDEPKEGDLVIQKRVAKNENSQPQRFWSKDNYMEGVKFIVTSRNNTPVYQCRQP